jgi:hypothetical protein
MMAQLVNSDSDEHEKPMNISLHHDPTDVLERPH